MLYQKSVDFIGRILLLKMLHFYQKSPHLFTKNSYLYLKCGFMKQIKATKWLLLSHAHMRAFLLYIYKKILQDPTKYIPVFIF